MSAAEAARNFSELLDLVEAGKTVRIMRGDKLIAEIKPVPRRTGADLEAAILATDLSPLDDDFERDIAETLALVSKEKGDLWAAPDSRRC